MCYNYLTIRQDAELMRHEMDSELCIILFREYDIAHEGFLRH